MPYESDPVTSKLNELIGSQDLHWALMFFDELDAAPQALIGTWKLANEIYNGGFLQYFHNGSGEHAVRMVSLLRLFDATEAATILENAIELAGPHRAWGSQQLGYFERLKAMPPDVGDQLSDLAKKFFDQSDDMHLRLYRYLAKHRDQLSAPEEFWMEASIQ